MDNGYVGSVTSSINTGSPNTVRTGKRSKYTTPCDLCSVRRIRCSEVRPCLGCIKRGVECTNNRIKKKSGPKGKRKKRGTTDTEKESPRYDDYEASAQPQNDFTSPMNQPMISPPQQQQQYILEHPPMGSFQPPPMSFVQASVSMATNGTSRTLFEDAAMSSQRTSVASSQYEPSSAGPSYQPKKNPFYNKEPSPPTATTTDSPLLASLASSSLPSSPESIKVSPTEAQILIFNYPLEIILKYLDIYHKMFYGIWPVINISNLISKLIATGDFSHMDLEGSIVYTQALSICGAISKQVTFLTEHAKLIQNGINAELCIKECVRAREEFNHKLKPDVNVMIVSLFLYEYYINTPDGTKLAMLYLREAISIAQILELHDPNTYMTMSIQESHQLRKMYYMLMITERYMCIEDGLPVILDACIPFPTLEDEEYPDLLTGFTELLKLFSVPDRSFFDKMAKLKKLSNNLEYLQNFLHDPNTVPTESWLVDVDKRLDAIKVVNFISDIQKVNILLSKHWMKSLTWHIAYKNGLLRQNDINSDQYPHNNPDDETNCLSLAYPKTIAYDFLSSVSNLPIFAFESNGPGVVVKLLEIAHGLADSINDLSLIKGESFNPLPVQDAMNSIFTLVAKFKTEVTLPTDLYRRIETMVNNFSVPRPLGYFEELDSDDSNSPYSRFKDTFTHNDFIHKLTDEVFGGGDGYHPAGSSSNSSSSNGQNHNENIFPFSDMELETNDPREVYAMITSRLTPAQMESFENWLTSVPSTTMSSAAPSPRFTTIG
ncbi:uncharacterized protein J8A68_000293 [[Candida] subhashii]|uniref:Zn(2)-C6 fungal-type domain-containing protein n=1 Tax=[Candida] subhashii TaxID=561895 RepID=A0A8J5QIC5_9ASCO|nr:uncharacterized protein J8A68_000293 [[Candida] subhashii]KAG7666164.1 hypothetical protein J8A68_000293 [[Candida] subhashii]